MKPIRSGAIALTIALAACVPQPRANPPAPAASPAPAPAPPPVQAPVQDNWRDAPQTPGDWSYRPSPGGGAASFGPSPGDGRFTMRCDAAARSVVLARHGAASATRMTIRTESQTRTLAVAAHSGAAETRLAASDRLLDAMAFSKGRFAVEMQGAQTLYVPSWAEVTRVIEDCR